MGFWNKLWTGTKVALVVANVANGRKIGKHKIQIKEIPDIVDLIAVVEATVKAAKEAEAAKPKDKEDGTSDSA